MTGASETVPLTLTDNFEQSVEAIYMLDMRDKHKAKNALLHKLSVTVPAFVLLLIFACMGCLCCYFKTRGRS